MTRPQHRLQGGGLTRRALLGTGAAAVLAAGGAALERYLAAPRHRPGPAAKDVRPVRYNPPPPTTTSSTPTTTTMPAPGPRVPVVPAAPRSAPVYSLHDYLPDAPANAVALTIDDGPDLPWTPQVLAVLAEYNVLATFSLVGVHVYGHSDLVRQMVADGHSVCNHSMTHPLPFATLPQDKMDAEISGGLQAIFATTGKVARVFRSPGGDSSPGMLASVARMGMTPIDWDVDPRDWSRPGTSYIVSKLLAAAPGEILLCHDGGGDRSETVTALKTVIPALQSRGLQFVAL